MITIISGTNNRGSKTIHFANHYYKVLQSKTKEAVKLLDLTELPTKIAHPDMYAPEGQSRKLAKLQNEFMLPADKFVFVIPEYNGSFPGVLKLFLDACSIREYKPTFSGKKAALVGVASGRAGNLRGMDHLSDILNHVGATVYPGKLPISQIDDLLTPKGQIKDKGTKEALAQHMDAFLAF